MTQMLHNIGSASFNVAVYIVAIMYTCAHHKSLMYFFFIVTAWYLHVYCMCGISQWGWFVRVYASEICTLYIYYISADLVMYHKWNFCIVTQLGDFKWIKVCSELILYIYKSTKDLKALW